ncbi:SagD family biosynthesis docking scaffold protein [Dictyobacter alpinus]|uniref:SagD family biosynthesis docking scaffold protein n=1 Tax=Dictyobacter alpinus TaxID=2014873 RepID=A0A402BDI6_9CHLR|nr:TOMM precursor leader peptide-binding protein [Dictyobacter alpinus]GCE29370.1 SagD family biosynthesis docking scaffold protein [Dictyobacter alpinus]
MSYLTQQKDITIEASLSTPSFDATLSLIERSLTEQIAAHRQQLLLPKEQTVLIDLAILDLSKSGDQREPTSRWQNYDMVYPIRLDQTRLLFGPLYRPALGGPCPLCLEQRWKLNQASLMLDQGDGSLTSAQRMLATGNSICLTSFTLELVWQITAAVFLRPTVEHIDHQLYALELGSSTLAQYLLLPDSLCPVCADDLSRTAQGQLIHLASRPKQNVADYHPMKASGYNLPEAAYINPICGVLGTEYYLDDDHTIDAPVIGRFAVQETHSSSYKVHWGGHGGKYSLQTGMLEGLERYSCVRRRREETTIFESYNNLNSPALHPAETGLYQPAFYQANAEHYTAFDMSAPIHWVWGYSFRKAQPLLVAEQLVFSARHNEPKCVSTNSSGCAIGGSVEEALLFGLFELIERDGLLLSWYTKTAPRRVNLWQCKDRQILHFLDRFEKSGYDVHLLDTRFDRTIPSVTAIASLRTFSSENMKIAVSVGGGANLNPAKAVLAALAEAGYWIDNVHVDDHLDEMRELALDYHKVISVVDHGLVYGLPESAPKTHFLSQNPQVCSFEEYATELLEQCPQTLDLREDLLYCIQSILAMGLDVIAVEIPGSEHERAGLKVCKVIVPGLLPIDFGGMNVRVLDLPRLRTAPRVAGYLERDFDPADYNRDPHPFS